MTESNLEKINQIRLVSVLAITQKAMERFGKERLAQIPDPYNSDLVSTQELGVLAKDTLANQSVAESVEQLSNIQQEDNFQQIIQVARNYTNGANHDLVEKQLQELEQLKVSGIENFKAQIQPLRIIEQSVDEIEIEQFEKDNLDLDSPITQIRELYFPSLTIYTTAELEQQLKLDAIEALASSLAQKQNVGVSKKVGGQAALLFNSIENERAFSDLVETVQAQLGENQFFMEHEDLMEYLDQVKSDRLEGFKGNFQSFLGEQRTSIEIKQDFKGISVEEQLARLKQNEEVVTIDNSTTITQMKTTDLAQQTEQELQKIKEQQLNIGETRVQQRQ
ncbi:MAG: hypothetical protein AAF806_10445 [Bacteroidota bacterium]